MKKKSASPEGCWVQQDLSVVLHVSVKPAECNKIYQLSYM